MDAVAVRVEGYRRFGAPNRWLDLRGELLAIVGPNEAGKSTLLDALREMETSETIDGDDVTRAAATRGELRVRISVRYAVDKADMGHLENRFAPEAVKGVTGVKVTKTETGGFTVGIEGVVPPALELLKKPAKRLARELERHSDSIQVEHADSIGELLAAIQEQRLPKEEDTELRRWVETIRESDGSEPTLGVAEALDPVLRLAQEDLGFRIAVYLWEKRSPSFLLFEAADRDLASTYSLTEKGRPTWNKALHNLCAYANLNLERLAGAVGDVSLVATILDSANRLLKSKLTSSWGQAQVSVRLQVSGNTLHVLTYDETHGNVLPISRRSEGLRQFVALMAFIARHQPTSDEVQPVLLIDEAEQHLHYDAQADLINVLVAQRETSKVIYTTHSAGCLPPDLGTGVRAIETYRSREAPEEAEPDSSLPANSIWSDTGAGYGPLLLAMGAGTFALTAARQAIVAEGFTDMMLVPTLLREASGEQLNFQIVEGIARAADSDLKDLRNVAINVAYLIDGDAAGDSYRDRLIDAGVPRKHIIQFGARTGKGPASPEDAVSQDIFLDVINDLLRREHAPPMARADIGDRGRWAAVENWARQSNKRCPSKKALAIGLLDRRDDGLVDPSARKRLRRLHKSMLAALADQA